MDNEEIKRALPGILRVLAEVAEKYGLAAQVIVEKEDEAA